MKYLIGIIALLLYSCTFSINMIDSKGYADDMIDENQKADADLKPTLNLQEI